MRIVISAAALFLGVAVVVGQPPADPAKKIDDKFVIGAKQGGQFEIQASNMALQRATDPAVKKFAQMMIDEHTKMAADLDKVAAGRGSVVPPNLIHAAILTKLATEQGKDFDECYMCLQVLAHEEALLCFRKEAKKGNNAELRAFADQALPKLREHLQMARKLCDGGMDDAKDALKTRGADH